MRACQPKRNGRAAALRQPVHAGTGHPRTAGSLTENFPGEAWINPRCGSAGVVHRPSFRVFAEGFGQLLSGISIALSSRIREDRVRQNDRPTNNDMDMLANRIRSEYREMPGLKLTLRQASRLFNLEAAACARALDALVGAGALRTDGRAFLNATDGPFSV